MAKQNNLIWIVLGIAILLIVTTGFKPELFAISGATMARSVPSQAEPSETFEIVYSVSGASGKWGASIVDSVTGGCKFPDGSATLKTVMLSTEGSVKRITVTAPVSSGTCTFSGDYKFGTEATKDFSDSTVNIVTGAGNGDVCPDIVGWKYFGGECVYTTDGCEVEYVTLEDCQSALGENGNGEVPSISLDRVLFDLNGFQVKLLHLIIIFVALIVIVMLKKK